MSAFWDNGLPAIPPSVLHKLAERMVFHPDTYRELAERLIADGWNFGNDGSGTPDGAPSVLRELTPEAPEVFDAIYGDGFFPLPSVLYDFSTLFANAISDPAFELDDWRLAVRGQFGPPELEVPPEQLQLEGVLVWTMWRLFQLRAAINLANVFNLDNRGRPPLSEE